MKCRIALTCFVLAVLVTATQQKRPGQCRNLNKCAENALKVGDSFCTRTWAKKNCKVQCGICEPRNNTGDLFCHSPDVCETTRGQQTCEHCKTTGRILNRLNKIDSAHSVLMAQMIGVMSRLSGMQGGVFETSASFNGKRYFLSKLIQIDLANADLTCRLFDGYLAEIRTQAENDFLYDFLITQGNIGREQVMLGATDEKTEGQWTYVSSGERVTYTDWKDGANGGRGSNCMFFTGTWTDGHTYNGMTTYYCKFSSLDRFLCQVPESVLNLPT